MVASEDGWLHPLMARIKEWRLEALLWLALMSAASGSELDVWFCFVVFVSFSSFANFAQTVKSGPPSPSNCSLSPQGVWRATGRMSKFGQRLSQCRCDRVRSANRQVPKVYYFYLFAMYFFIVFVILSRASISLTGLACGDAVDIVHGLDTKERGLTLWSSLISW